MSQLTIQQAIELGAEHHRAGRFGEAESLYRQILAVQPQHPDALHLLGLLAIRTNQPQEALELIQRAVALLPEVAVFHDSLGQALAACGRVDEAIGEYERAIALNPKFAEVHNNLGAAMMLLGRADQALACFQRAAALGANYAMLHENLATALMRLGRKEEAIAEFKAALAMQPDSVAMLTNMAIAMIELRRFDEVLQPLHRAIALNPNLAEPHNALGIALRGLERFDEAIAEYDQALSLDANFAEAHNNLATALMSKDQFEQALPEIRRALELKPDLIEAISNLAGCQRELGQLDEAIATFRSALARRPDLTTLHYNLSTALLLKGDLAEGFAEYEYRWQVKELDMLWPAFVQPLWNGEDLHGKRILLHTEQGYGDAIQFIRYAPLVAQRGGKVIICCPSPLEGLFRRAPGVDMVLPGDVPPTEFDVHCPLLRLPVLFKTTLETIPATVPYLPADPQLVERWRGRVANAECGLRNAELRSGNSAFRNPTSALNVGLVWAGRPEHKNDRNRSITLNHFAPLANVAGVRFFSLQFGPPAAQARNPPKGIELIDWTKELDDFAQTAALIQNLDLVITADTAAAHLAGALGKPVWILITSIPDWRWLLDRNDSPWYPTARLFRQPARGDWQTPIKRIAKALVDQLR